METLQAKFTFKRATKSLKKFFTLDRRVRGRKPLVSELFEPVPHPAKGSSPSSHESQSADARIDPNEPKEVIHVFGILGIVGPLDAHECGWMATDFAAWAFLVGQMKGYTSERTVWRTIRHIDHLFLDHSVAFRDAGCDRLVLPLPSTFDSDLDPFITSDLFKTDCLLSLAEMARKVQSGETMFLLLIGHGSFNNAGQFQYQITTQVHDITGEAFITKHDLELVLKTCKGDIIVACNSCYSGGLVSEHWTLLCATTEDDTSDLLCASGSGCFRGSHFTACVVGQAALEHGLRVPLPRNEAKSNSSVNERFLLPPSAPPHSFSNTAQVSIIKPSNISLEEFTCRMIHLEQFLVENCLSVFGVAGSRSKISWTSSLPIEFTAEAVGRIGVKAEAAWYRDNYYSINPAPADSHTPQGGPPPSLGCQRPQFNCLLLKLLAAMGDIPCTIEPEYTKIREDFQRHIAEPERYAAPVQTPRNLIGQALRSKHVQAIATQHIARELGWWNDGVTPFLRQTITHLDLGEMVESGIRVDKLPWQLKKRHFQRLNTEMDCDSAKWLLVQWAAAGRPRMSCSKWDELVETVGVITKKEAICP